MAHERLSNDVTRDYKKHIHANKPTGKARDCAVAENYQSNGNRAKTLNIGAEISLRPPLIVH